MGWLDWFTNARRSIEEVDDAVEFDRLQELLLGDRRQDYDMGAVPSVGAHISAAPKPSNAWANGADIQRLCDAIRSTVEYVGTATLPALPGWSWYDALVKYDPEAAAYLASLPRSQSEDSGLCGCHLFNGVKHTHLDWHREEK